MPTISGAFTVKLAAQAVTDGLEAHLGRRSIDKVYQGPLSGTGRGEMLSAGAATPGSAGYVAIERVEGSIEGRNGSFHLQHFGLMKRGEGSLRIEVIPDSGTGELAGLSGEMRIEIAPGGAHAYIFDYRLA